MALYDYAAGWDASVLATWPGVFLPRCPGLKDGVRRTAGDGLIYQDGFMTATLTLTFQKSSDYSSLLAALGLSSARSAKLTMNLPRNGDRASTKYNLIIVRPDSPDDAAFTLGKWLDITFQVMRIHPA